MSISMLVKYSRPIKFIGGGIISATVEFSSFYFLVDFFDLYIASVTSFLLGLVTSFLFNKFIVFKSNASQRGFTKEVISFGVLGLVNSQLSGFLTISLASLFQEEFVAKIVTMMIIAAWNYIIMGKIIFKNGAGKL